MKNLNLYILSLVFLTSIERFAFPKFHFEHELRLTTPQDTETLTISILQMEKLRPWDQRHPSSSGNQNLGSIQKYGSCPATLTGRLIEWQPCEVTLYTLDHLTNGNEGNNSCMLCNIQTYRPLPNSFFFKKRLCHQIYEGFLESMKIEPGFQPR